MLDPCIRYEVTGASPEVDRTELEVGLAQRYEVFGKPRLHLVVLRSPLELLIELNGSDSERGAVVWRALQHGSRKIVPNVASLPPEYRQFRHGPFTNWITGPNARNGVGVAIDLEDHLLMIQLALIRESNKPLRSRSSTRAPEASSSTPLDADTRSRVTRELAKYQSQYLAQCLYPIIRRVTQADVGDMHAVFEPLSRPVGSLALFLTYYAFARAGGEQAGYGAVCEQLLLPYCDEAPWRFWARFPNGEALWEAFAKECASRGIGSNAKLNQGLLVGLHELASETPEDGLLARLSRILATPDGPNTATTRLRAIHGIGPKIAAFVLRDVALLGDVERSVKPEDSWMLQPVDVWTRRVAAFLRPDVSAFDSTQIGMALAECARDAGVAGSALNQGAWFFGSHVAESEFRLGGLLRELVENSHSGVGGHKS